MSARGAPKRENGQADQAHGATAPPAITDRARGKTSKAGKNLAALDVPGRHALRNRVQTVLA